MSIGTEITRLQNAKAAIKTAIAGKGVTVAEGTLLDGMAALIDSIAQSPFPGDVVTQLYVGTLVPATNVTNYPAGGVTITHNLGVVPDLVLLLYAMSATPVSGEIIACVDKPSVDGVKKALSTMWYTPSDSYIVSVSSQIGAAETSTTETNIDSMTASRKLVQGHTYLTMALKFA